MPFYLQKDGHPKPVVFFTEVECAEVILAPPTIFDNTKQVLKSQNKGKMFVATVWSVLTRNRI